MHGHLVTIKVSVEGSTNQRVKLDGLSFDQFWLEGLDTKPVQCWRTVQQYRMPLQYIFKDVPYNGILTIHNLLGRFHSLHNTALNQFSDDKWLVEFSSHIFRQTALMKSKFRTNNNNRTCRIVDPLTKQVLAETSLLTFQTVGK